MSYIHTLPEQMRIDAALMQYTARQYDAVDYHIHPVILNGQCYYISEVERCSACGEPDRLISFLAGHYQTVPHIAEMYRLPKHTLEKQLNSERHDAIRCIVLAYQYRTRGRLSSFIPLEPVIRKVSDILPYRARKLTLPQLEELVTVLQLHVPDYYEKTKESWVMQLLAAQ
jgi:hypothetical protein